MNLYTTPMPTIELRFVDLAEPEKGTQNDDLKVIKLDLKVIKLITDEKGICTLYAFDNGMSYNLYRQGPDTDMYTIDTIGENHIAEIRIVSFELKGM